MASRKPNEQTHLEAQGWGRGEQRSWAKVRDLRVLGRIGWLAAAARLQELETEDSKERSLD